MLQTNNSVSRKREKTLSSALSISKIVLKGHLSPAQRLILHPPPWTWYVYDEHSLYPRRFSLATSHACPSILLDLVFLILVSIYFNLNKNPIIQNYRKIIIENWQKKKCTKSDISLSQTLYIPLIVFLTQKCSLHLSKL